MALILRYFTDSVASRVHRVKVVEGIVVKKFTFATSSPDEFLVHTSDWQCNVGKDRRTMAEAAEGPRDARDVLLSWSVCLSNLNWNSKARQGLQNLTWRCVSCFVFTSRIIHQLLTNSVTVTTATLYVKFEIPGFTRSKQNEWPRNLNKWTWTIQSYSPGGWRECGPLSNINVKKLSFYKNV